ncbi:hypothetical protein ElyMa_003178700 [Elysia marginata]|uniref:Ig-like domain-containing protein n=1 Tax=Elysia marginata TaxID=1093978 RepID=A0AAV4IY55_9GAST|nr:hypothetical protein ElyMa_003178700 [Elysia marginata]
MKPEKVSKVGFAMLIVTPAISLAFSLEAGLTTPRLSGFRPVLAEGETTRVVCTASLLDKRFSRGVAWQLITKTHRLSWLVESSGAVLVLRGETTIDARVDVLSVSRDEMHRTVVESVMILLANGLVQGAALTCSTLVFRSPNVQLPRLSASTYPLEVTFEPRRPKLVVHYAREPSVVYDHTVLRGTCSAYVGTGGSLVWQVVDLDWSRDLPETCYLTTGDNVTESEPCEAYDFIVTQENATGNQPHPHGPYIKSSLEMNVTVKMDGYFIRCSVVSQVSAHKEDLAASSLPLIVEGSIMKTNCM